MIGTYTFMHGDKKMSYVAEGNMACNIMVDGDVINLDAAIGEINFKSARGDKINRIEVKKLNSKSDIFIGELIDNAWDNKQRNIHIFIAYFYL